MIRSNGNGTYSVDFQVNGKDDYVTVDSELPTNGAYGLYYAKTGSDDFIWVPLVEKAYAELMQNPDVEAGEGGNTNSYDAIYGGWGNGLQAITGQTTTEYSTTSSQLSSALAAAMANGQNVMYDSNTADDGLVAGHMYTVTNFNQKTGMITLRNPWGRGAGSDRLRHSLAIEAPAPRRVLHRQRNGREILTRHKAGGDAALSPTAARRSLTELGTRARRGAAPRQYVEWLF